MAGPLRSRSLVVAALTALTALTVLTTAPAGAATTDDAVAQAGVLVATDLGPGWTETPVPMPGLVDDSLYAKVPACRRLQDSLALFSGRATDALVARSARFSNGAIQVHNTVTVEPTARDAKRVMRAVSSGGYRTCIRRAEQRALASANIPGKAAKKLLNSLTVTVSRRTVRLPVRNMTGLTMTVSSAQNPDPAAVPLHFTYAVVRLGPALDAFSVTDASASKGSISADELMPSVRRLVAALAA